MRNGFLAAAAALAAGAAIAMGQPEALVLPPAELTEQLPVSYQPAVAMGQAAFSDASPISSPYPYPVGFMAAPRGMVPLGPLDSILADDCPAESAPSRQWFRRHKADLADEDPADGYCSPYSQAAKHDKCCHFWAGAEYLRWSSKDGPVASPLVTTGPPTGVPILGAPETSVLFGGSDLDYGRTSGTRFAAGCTNPDQTIGMEFVGLWLPETTSTFSAESTPEGLPVLARPFINAATGEPTATLVAFPGGGFGRIDISSASRLWGVELNVTRHMLSKKCFGDGFMNNTSMELDMVAGARYLDLREDLSIVQNTTVLDPGFAGFAGNLIQTPSELTISDQFLNRNQFYGGQWGLQTEFRKGCFFLFLSGKIGVGMTHQSYSATGSTALATPGAPTATVPGGLLAVASNSGGIHSERFTWLPEATMTFGWEFKHCLRLYAGYNILYWSDVGRPGDQINPEINVNQIPTSLAFGTGFGPTAPLFTSRHSDYWIGGLTAGFAFRY